jgi:hypothetical protein
VAEAGRSTKYRSFSYSRQPRKTLFYGGKGGRKREVRKGGRKGKK